MIATTSGDRTLSGRMMIHLKEGVSELGGSETTYHDSRMPYHQEIGPQIAGRPCLASDWRGCVEMLIPAQFQVGRKWRNAKAGPVFDELLSTLR